MTKILLLIIPMLVMVSCTKSKQEQAQDKTANIMEQIKARQEFERRRRLALQQQQDKFFTNPLKPALDEQQVFRGPASAKVTIVEYTDFECPYCSRGSQTMKEIKRNYGNKVRVTIKHLPLSFHKHAMISAQYYEAIALQSKDKAWRFHDQVFQNQASLKGGGEGFLQEMAKKVGADLAQVKKDLNSKKVTSKIARDAAEAAKFGFTGTPAFLVNGVPMKGAQPAEAFAAVIDRHLGN